MNRMYSIPITTQVNIVLIGGGGVCVCAMHPLSNVKSGLTFWRERVRESG